MSIVLEIKESSTEVISGVPQFVTATTNIVADIYYTFDGTDPTSGSLLAIDKIYLPTDINSFTFKCIAYDGSSYSEVYSKDYSISTPDIKNTRKGNEGGIIIYEVGEDVVESFGFASDGTENQSMTINKNSVDFITSKTDKSGGPIPNNSSKDFINFAKKSLAATKPEVSSLNGTNFNPKAKVILIDGKTPLMVSGETNQ